MHFYFLPGYREHTRNRIVNQPVYQIEREKKKDRWVPLLRHSEREKAQDGIPYKGKVCGGLVRGIWNLI